MHRKYSFKVPGIRWEINWFEDSDVEEEFRRRDGKLIPLPAATALYYNASIVGSCPQTLRVVQEVQDLGILGYARSLGFRVDLFPYLISENTSKDS